MTDHTPSPATDGLREVIEALADEARARKAAYPKHRDWTAWDLHESDLRDALAAHPAPLADPAPEAAREDDETPNWAEALVEKWRPVPTDLPVATGVTTEDDEDAIDRAAEAISKADGYMTEGEARSCARAALRAAYPAPAPVVSAGDEGVSGSSLHVTEAPRVDSESSDGRTDVAHPREVGPIRVPGPEPLYPTCTCDPNDRVRGLASLDCALSAHRSEAEHQRD